ncbi:hypothetical protein J3R82DRAFT_1455 [Butyriboletus roseoflavus]|nr:hypothetical protein J3R82DRAFT_1455 [Butyriboletus roseoflavus]
MIPSTPSFGTNHGNATLTGLRMSPILWSMTVGYGTILPSPRTKLFAPISEPSLPSILTFDQNMRSRYAAQPFHHNQAEWRLQLQVRHSSFSPHLTSHLSPISRHWRPRTWSPLNTSYVSHHPATIARPLTVTNLTTILVRVSVTKRRDNQDPQSFRDSSALTPTPNANPTPPISSVSDQVIASPNARRRRQRKANRLLPKSSTCNLSVAPIILPSVSQGARDDPDVVKAPGV